MITVSWSFVGLKHR